MRGRRRHLWSITTFNVRIAAMKKKDRHRHCECALTKGQQLFNSIGLQEMRRANRRTFHAAGYQ